MTAAIWAPGVTDDMRARAIELPLSPHAHGIANQTMFGYPVKRDPRTGFATGMGTSPDVGKIIGYNYRSLWVDPGATAQPVFIEISYQTGDTANVQNLPRRRFTAKRDACGFLLCGECNQPSPYAEPNADGSFTCRGCLLMREASQ
jgi:hypothetical protein